MPRRYISFSSIALLASITAFAAVMSPRLSYSGELDSERDEDYGVAFVGSARSTGTLEPIPDVQIKAEMGNRKLLVRTNGQGIYKLIANFGNDVKPDEIAISCAKDGYENVDVSRRVQSSASGRELIVAECLLAPKKS